MQTSRFQLGLIATLAVGLGFSLASSDAVGYPASAISRGSNPIVSATGYLSSSPEEAFAPTADQQLILTDVIVSARRSVSSGCASSTERHLVIRTGSGDDLALFGLRNSASGVDEFHYASGIPVPAGESVEVYHSGCGDHIYMNYSLSGYYAQP
jgi:hypothetical protein